MKKHSRSVEDYLKHIYNLQIKNGIANTGNIADILAIKPASVTEMIKKLESKKLLVNKPYLGFKLTKKGKAIALRQVRKHRIIETFLYEFLKYPVEMIHEEAEILEHSVSDEFIKKLDVLMQYPAIDPHKEPIPDENGFYK